MTLAAGAKLGPYEIVSPLGAGGMGEVYRARDPRLNRDVAMKVLPEEFFEGEERRQRFEREARLLAALNHPGIAAIYSFEEIPGSSPILTMELVEGDDLAVRLASGPLPLEESLSLARQIAEALEAAHEKGIVHRDLKPANVKVTPDGRVKLLDFGLAKAIEGDSGSGSAPSVTHSPTLTARGTAAGVILGTAAYMSPEQARGKPVDKRTDVWAFGCVLYEMLAGKRAFEGETVTDVLAAVLTRDPDFAALPAPVPAGVRRVLRKCLQRDAKLRLRDIGDARLDLEEAAAPPGFSGRSPFEEGTALPSPTAGRSDSARVERGSRSVFSVLLPWALAAAFAAAAGALALRARAPQAPRALRKLDLAVPALDMDWFSAPTLSPDGSRIAYSAGNRIWVRDLAQLGVRSIAEVSALTALCWSPDSQAVVYGERKKLWRVPAAGGNAIAIADVPGTGVVVGASWSRSGRLAFSVWRGGLYLLPAQGGEPALLLEPDPDRAIDFHFPSWLPNEDLLYLIHWRDAPVAGGRAPDYLAVWNGREHVPIALDTGGTDASPVYVSGHLLLVRPGANAGVWAAPYDVSGRRVTGDAFPVAPGALAFSASSDGSLLYVEQAAMDVAGEMAWVDRSGKTLGVVGPSRTGLTQPALSPDGRRIAFLVSSQKSRSLWVHDVERGTQTRLTFGPDTAMAPAWLSPSRLTYVEPASSPGSIGGKVVALNADGSGGRQVLTPEIPLGLASSPLIASPDGRYVLQIVDEKGRGRLRVADLRPDGTIGPGRPILRIEPEPAVSEARVSPDGRLVAYSTDEPGLPEMFLTRFPSGEGRWQVGTQSARSPRWARDSGELFFLTGFQQRTPAVVRVNSSLDPPLASAPETLGTALTGLGGRGSGFAGDDFDVAADGRKFLIVRSAAGAAPQRMVLVQNWLAEFAKERAP